AACRRGTGRRSPQATSGRSCATIPAGSPRPAAPAGRGRPFRSSGSTHLPRASVPPELAAGAGFWTYPIPFPPAPPAFHAGSGDSPKIPHVPRAPLFRPAPARLRPRPPEVRRPPQHCRAGSAPLGKPHRMAITVRILGNEGADDEAGLLHHPRVIRRRQTGMIDGQSADTAHRLARVRPAREEERAPLLEMAGEDREHGPLVVGGEMEETVPGNDAAEAPAEIEMPHVGPDPLAPGPAPAADREHRLGDVHPGHPVAGIDQPVSYRLARAAAEIEHRASRRHP